MCVLFCCQKIFTFQSSSFNNLPLCLNLPPPLLTVQHMVTSVARMVGFLVIKKLNILILRPQKLLNSNALPIHISMVCLQSTVLNKCLTFKTSQTLFGRWHTLERPWPETFTCGIHAHCSQQPLGTISGLSSLWLGALPLCPASVIPKQYSYGIGPLVCYSHQTYIGSCLRYWCTMEGCSRSLWYDRLNTGWWCSVENIYVHLLWTKTIQPASMDGRDIWTECSRHRGCPRATARHKGVWWTIWSHCV